MYNCTYTFESSVCFGERERIIFLWPECVRVITFSTAIESQQKVMCVGWCLHCFKKQSKKFSWVSG